MLAVATAFNLALCFPCSIKFARFLTETAAVAEVWIQPRRSPGATTKVAGCYLNPGSPTSLSNLIGFTLEGFQYLYTATLESCLLGRCSVG